MRAWWSRVHEPRVEKATYFVVYAGIAALGALTGFDQPQTIAEPLGPLLTAAWVILWVLSALVGMATVFAGWWAVERIGLWLGLLGVGIYTGVVIALHFTAGGSRAAQMTVLWIAAGFYVVRLVRIWGRDFEPRH